MCQSRTLIPTLLTFLSSHQDISQTTFYISRYRNRTEPKLHSTERLRTAWGKLDQGGLILASSISPFPCSFPAGLKFQEGPGCSSALFSLPHPTNNSPPKNLSIGLLQRIFPRGVNKWMSYWVLICFCV